MQLEDGLVQLQPDVPRGPQPLLGLVQPDLFRSSSLLELEHRAERDNGGEWSLTLGDTGVSGL